jgi:hypothetical protein
MKQNKLDIRKDTPGNAYITRVPQAHGIVSGSANYPLGRITLDVCFDNRQNYRKEKLDFEVMDICRVTHEAPRIAAYD